jgi:hypothetical protein
MVLSVGDRVLMQYATLGDRLLGVITDIRPGESIVVYSPLSSLARQRLRENNTAFLRYVHEGVLKGYKTNVVLDALNGDCLVTLAYPLEEFFAERRTEPRCPCCFPARVVLGQREYQGHVVDVSASAVRVRFEKDGPGPDAFDQDRDVRLDFNVFEPENRYGAFCSVLKSFMDDGAVYAVLEIRDGEAVRDTLAKYVESQCRGGALNQV